MNLIEKLLRVDKETALARETKTIPSKRLSKLVGEGAEITIKEIQGRKYSELQSMLYDSKGNRRVDKMYDFNLMCCVNGVVEPSLTDKTLMEHFGAATPKDLAAILFGLESSAIASEIIALSGLADEAEEEVKNS